MQHFSFSYKYCCVIENLLIQILENQTKMHIDLDGVKKITTCIEQDHGKKLEALLDGYKQSAEQLNRIEKEVSRHEEVILRRVK